MLLLERLRNAVQPPGSKDSRASGLRRAPAGNALMLVATDVHQAAPSTLLTHSLIIPHLKKYVRKILARLLRPARGVAGHHFGALNANIADRDAFVGAGTRYILVAYSIDGPILK